MTFAKYVGQAPRRAKSAPTWRTNEVSGRGVANLVTVAERHSETGSRQASGGVLLAFAAEHGEICQPSRQGLDHRQEVFGCYLDVIDFDVPGFLVLTQ